MIIQRVLHGCVTVAIIDSFCRAPPTVWTTAQLGIDQGRLIALVELAAFGLGLLLNFRVLLIEPGLYSFRLLLVGLLDQLELELTLFGGHLMLTQQGVQDAEKQTTVPGGISPTDRRTGRGRPKPARVASGVRADQPDHCQLAGASSPRRRQALAWQGGLEQYRAG
jgi:hypothetical protein